MCVLRPPHGAYITLVLQQIEQLVECRQVSGLIRRGQHHDIGIHVSVKGQFSGSLRNDIPMLCTVIPTPAWAISRRLQS